MKSVTKFFALTVALFAFAACAPTPGPVGVQGLIAADPATETLAQRAEEGDPTAQRRLAERFYRGIDEIAYENYERAAYWYAEAANQGDLESQRMMGTLYREGRGVERDRAEAYSWYRRAAERGDPVGQYWTGIALTEWSDAVDTDRVAAYTWLELASRSYEEIAGQAAEARDRLADDLSAQDLTWARLMVREFSPTTT